MCTGLLPPGANTIAVKILIIIIIIIIITKATFIRCWNTHGNTDARNMWSFRGSRYWNCSAWCVVIRCAGLSLSRRRSKARLTNAVFHCAGELISPCRFVILPLNFGSPALEELAVLDFLSTLPMCWRNNTEWGVTAVLMREDVLPLGSTAESFQDSCWLESVAPRKLYRVVSHSLFLNIFYIILIFR